MSLGLTILAAVAVAVLFFLIRALIRRPPAPVTKEELMKLPPPDTKGMMPLETALANRRSVRSYTPEPLTPEQLGQLLWAAQGITSPRGFRTAPSAGALYPMDIYIALGDESVPGFEAGVYRYIPDEHAVISVWAEDVRHEIARAALSQMWMAKPPLILVITAEYSRLAPKYGQRGVRYAVIEAGHIGQNVFLQAQSLGLAAGIVGAFRDEGIVKALNTPPSHEPLLIMPVGYGRS